MAKEVNISLIPVEKLALANRGDHIKDQKFDDKPIGYFKDAWRRFCKNKASIVAAIIIICIVLFAIIVPFLNSSGTGTKSESRYQRKGPRNLFLSQFGIATGTLTDDHRDTAFIQLAAMGIAANPESFDRQITVGEAINSGDPLQPVKQHTGGYLVQQGAKWVRMNTLVVDSYLSVGFVFLDIEQEEYHRIKAWEEENNIKVIYPMIAENEYNMYYQHVTKGESNANWWYKTDLKGNPLRLNDSGTKYNELEYYYVQEVVLEDNYLRDSEGNLVDWKYMGGGDAETAMYRVRVLFYNYYRYTHDGNEPEFIFGTDSVGFDLAYRMAVGIRLSLILSVCIFAINFILGACYGAIEGYYGGTADLIMEFIAYILSGIPFMVTASLFQIHLAAKAGPIPSLLFAFVLTGWIGTASLVRTQFYRFKNQEYVMAARTLGAKDSRVIWKHIFPNTLGTIITSSVLAIPSVIFSESMLSYLGIVNLSSSTITSLGTLLSEASKIWTSKPHLMIFPAAVISLLMICFNLFGNGLRDAFNPSLRGTEE